MTGNAYRPPAYALMSAGVLGGLLAGFFGVGGGIVMVPLLVWLAKMDQRRAQATSLLAIAPAAVIGATSYAIGGVFPWLPALLVAIGALGGAQAGAWLLRKLSLGWLRWTFIVFLIVMATLVILTVPNRGVQVDVDVRGGLLLLAIGVLMGITAGLFGIGGGIVAIPALMFVFGIGDLQAKGISLLAMAPAALSGSYSHLRHELATPRDGVWIALAALVATPLGSLGAFVLPGQLANIVFGAFGLIIAGALIAQSLSRRGTSTQE